MGSIRGRRIAMQAQERQRRLQTPSPDLHWKYNITKESAIQLITPLAETQVTEEDFKFALSVLEFASTESDSLAKTVARYIANNITLGLVNEAGIDLEDYNINEECKSIIEEGITTTAICNRILENQTILYRRFDVDNAVRGKRHSIGGAIQELCELIDTYEVPNHYKYNIALENIMYTLVKNGVYIDNDDDIATAITEYFLSRDLTITDSDYQEYQQVLEENPIYNAVNSESPLLKCFIESSGHYFRDQVIEVLESMDDKEVADTCILEVKNMVSESDALDYMYMASGVFGSLSESDQAKICYSIQHIPNYAQDKVSPVLVNLKKKEYFDAAKFDALVTSDCILPKERAINGSDEDEYSIFNKSVYLDSFREAKDTDKRIADLIAAHKASQDKSANGLAGFIKKLFTKSPEAIFNELPNIFLIIHGGVLFLIASLSPITLVLSAITGLVSMLLNKHINQKEAKRLLDTIKKEKEKTKKELDKASDKKKQELEQYMNTLKDCEKKVEKYYEELTGDFADDDEDSGNKDDDDMGFDDDDLDFDLESVALICDTEVRIMTEMYEGEDIDLTNMIITLAEHNLLSEASEFIKRSSIPKESYAKALSVVKEQSNDVKVRTAITAEQDSIENIITISPYRDLIAEHVSNKVVRDIEAQVLNEKFSLNSVKLALQNGKAAMKGLNLKQKQLWQSIDAAGSGLVSGIEKATSSNRREAIIKGNIIPSLSKCIKLGIALAGVGVFFSPLVAAIGAVGMFAVNAGLDAKEKKLLMDEIDTELEVVNKQIDLAQNDGDMNQYRFLLNYKKKLTREYQRIRYGLKVTGRDIPQAVIPGK